MSDVAAGKAPIWWDRSDDPAGRVVSRLHDLSERQARSAGFWLLTLRRRLRRWTSGRSMDWTDPALRRFLGDKLVALDREKCRLCYLLCRAINATRILEVGTSFGVSTIYLAAAARDNKSGDHRPGVVIGTEIDPAKAAAARANLEEAQLAGFVDIREGDFRTTLQTLPGPIDFVLMDIWAPLARPALELVHPHLRTGAVIVCDNIRRFRRDYEAFLDFLDDPANGLSSTTLPLRGGLELSIRVA